MKVLRENPLPVAAGDRDDDEGALLDRARAGDEPAFALLYRRHQGRIYRLALGLTGNESDAEDAVQVVFERVWGSLGRFLPRASFGTWLYRVAVNVVLDDRKRAYRRYEWPTEQCGDDRPSPDLDPEAALQARRDRVLLRRALRCLPEGYRAPLVLREIEGLSYAEIVPVLSLPATTIKMRVVRGREKLAKALAQMGP